ncbi:hypothetical protein [Thiothrix nivea]|uniref:Uncharacterized protein n=1 Tax=Thiothrix nivea (strain ATCC 35100 / DSM 5205 / JP2) TaxID=870187 RepID=A0A656HG11_THINJ|nr:hypothetical protein [Thiothrix nivea]EIJ33965.1 hypothetical protein Thini_1359 [Thiothrix nivea DSM 5205]
MTNFTAIHHVCNAGENKTLKRILSQDPYIYLSQYLTNKQLEELLSYEYKSKEQIDRLIEMIDITGACDASLRAKAYELIEKSKKT